MHAFDFEEFDLHAAAQPFRERQTGGDSLCTGCRLTDPRGDADLLRDATRTEGAA